MRLVDKSSLTDAIWSSYSDDAIWQSPWYEMRLCAPCVLPPDVSPDGLWHLFAHSWMGIEHYSSTSGFDWKKRALVVARGHYPSLYRQKDRWHLVYEAHDRDYSLSVRLDRRRTISRIYLMTSSDLMSWSRPTVILSAADVPYASDFSVPRLAHPQIVSWEGGYRLYFTASEVRMYDTGQKASTCLSYAQSAFINADYSLRAKPVMRFDPDDRHSDLALGAFSFVSCSDGLVAFQTAFSFDEEAGRSRSSIWMLSSDDGEDFRYEKCIMKAPDEGWAGRCLTSCSLSFRPSEDTWYCYYSANGRDPERPWLPVREKLGLLIGNMIREAL